MTQLLNVLRQERNSAPVVKLWAVVLFLVVGFWAYLNLPEFFLEKISRYQYVSTIISFADAPPESVEQALRRARNLPGVHRVECRQVDTAETIKKAIAFECFLVQNMAGQWAMSHVFPPAHGWSWNRGQQNLRAGLAFWVYPLDFPLAQSLFQLAFAFALAWAALRGEWRRFFNAIPRRVAWVLFPAAITVAYLGLFWLQTGKPLEFGRACVAADYGDSLNWLYPIVIAAIGEELVYRGWGFRLLERAGWSPRWVLSITSIAFALMHTGNFDAGPLRWSLITAASYFASAFAFGLIRARTGSVLLCILAHALSNLIATAVC